LFIFVLTKIAYLALKQGSGE